MEKTKVSFNKSIQNWFGSSKARRGVVLCLLATGVNSYGWAQTSTPSTDHGFVGINYYDGYLAPGFGLYAQIDRDDELPGNPIPLTLSFYQSQLYKYAVSVNLYNSGADYKQGANSIQNSKDSRNIFIQVQPSQALRLHLDMSQDKSRDNQLYNLSLSGNSGWDETISQETLNLKTETSRLGLGFSYLSKDGMIQPALVQLDRMRYHPELFTGGTPLLLRRGQLYAEVQAYYSQEENVDQISASEWYRHALDYRRYASGKMFTSLQDENKVSQVSTSFSYGIFSSFQGALYVDWYKLNKAMMTQRRDSEYRIDGLVTDLAQRDNLIWSNTNAHSFDIRSEFLACMSDVWTQKIWIDYRVSESLSDSRTLIMDTSGRYRNDTAKEIYRQTDSSTVLFARKLRDSEQTIGFATLFAPKTVHADLSEFLANWHDDFGSRLPMGHFSQFSSIKYTYFKTDRTIDSFGGFAAFNLKSRYGLLPQIELANDLTINNYLSYDHRKFVDPFVLNRAILSWATFTYGEKFSEKFNWNRLSPMEQRYGPQLLPGMAIGEISYVICATGSQWKGLHTQDRWVQSTFRLGLPAGLELFLSDGLVNTVAGTIDQKDAFNLGVTYYPLPYIRFMVDWHDSKYYKGLQIRLVSLF